MTKKCPHVASVLLVMKKWAHHRLFRDWGKDSIPSKKILMKEAGVSSHTLNKALGVLEEHGFIKQDGYVRTYKSKDKKHVTIDDDKLLKGKLKTPPKGRGVVKNYLFQDKIKLYYKETSSELVEAGDIFLPQQHPKDFRKQQSEVLEALEQLNSGIIPSNKEGIINIEIKKEVKQIILQINNDGGTGNLYNIGSVNEDGTVSSGAINFDAMPKEGQREIQNLIKSALDGEVSWNDAIKHQRKLSTSNNSESKGN
jgi:hypothetical protein